MGTPDRRCGIWFDRLDHWQEELRALRALLLDGPVDEAFKWRGPVYRAHGGNIAILWGFKAHCALGFFKGVLLDDPEALLVAPGPNSRSARMICFTDLAEVEAREDAVRDYLARAVENQRTGRRVTFASDDLEMPEELSAALAADPDLNAAFEALTPGRQRGYVLQISGAKQSATRARRVEKWAPLILQGKGMHDR
ncbi:YdeI/OmpD-associated family protein [Marinovum sp.]|uniref:YdeI/OmpD-associated family protein n=1 Tax=Marinovum sp. TaxID=2024839 RepID=UPI002B2732B9|nr:YdeI/OmpD-associated family protein [Marinovum sp.]